MSDTFRSTYRQLTPYEAEHVAEIKLRAELLHQLLVTTDNKSPGMREMALARTKLEECVMWATKAIT